MSEHPEITPEEQAMVNDLSRMVDEQTLAPRPTNPWSEALDAVWSELTPEQVGNLPDGVASMCRANHDALWHGIPWDHAHHFAWAPEPKVSTGLVQPWTGEPVDRGSSRQEPEQ